MSGNQLKVLCVRCGTWAEFTSSTPHGAEAEAKLSGWDILRGDTHGMRHGRCPAHAIKVPA